MGRVWRARDQFLEREVAVKEVLLPPQSPEEHAELAARMLREARAAARLFHPGVVTIYDVVEYEGTPWIVMRFISGPSLRADIARTGQLTWQRAAEIGTQVADALAHAHAAGIVHRDLKPDNILLSESGAVVADFGIARIIGASTRLTGSDVRLGTVHYMAPEYLNDGNAGPPADMWALGATLYTAVEGSPPFGGATFGAVVMAIMTSSPAPPAHAGPLRALIEDLLAKDPDQRPDAQSVVSRLSNVSPPPIAASGATNPVAPPIHLSTTGAKSAPASRPAPVQSSLAQSPPARAAPSLAPTAAPSRPTGSHYQRPFGVPPASGTWPPLRPHHRGRIAVLVGALAVAGLVAFVLSPSSPGVAVAQGVAVSGTRIGVLSDPDGYGVENVAFSPDGDAIAASFYSTKKSNGHTDIWTLADRKLADLLTEPGNPIASWVAFSPMNSNSLAVAGTSGVTLWNLATRNAHTYTDSAGDPAESVAYTSDGGAVVGASMYNGTVFFMNPGNGQSAGSSFNEPGSYMTMMNSSENSLNQVAVSPTGSTLAVSGSNGADQEGYVFVSNLSGGSSLEISNATPWDGDPAMAFSPDGKTLAIVLANGLRLLNVADGDLSDPGLKGEQNAAAVTYSPDGSTLAVAYDNGSGEIYLWDVATRKGKTIGTGIANLSGLAFSPHGRTLVRQPPIAI